jgi:ribonuclease Z
MAWSLRILGTNAAVPVHDRFPSAQALQCGNQVYLIDCGEGTQTRLSDCGVKRSKINHIFISHLHGDHIFGLPGLITSYNLFRREHDLHLYGPIGLEAFIKAMLQATSAQLGFALHIHEYAQQHVKVMDGDEIEVYSLPLAHRVPCIGYLFVERVRPRKINKEAIAHYQVPLDQMKSLQEGHDWYRSDGQKIKNTLLTHAGRDPLSYAYCSDTAYHLPIVPLIEGVSVLYHESTFTHELAAKARLTGHSTATEAAMIANAANVELLLLGHFSSRYLDPQILGVEARRIFPHSLVATEGMLVDFENLPKYHGKPPFDGLIDDGTRRPG